MNQLPIPASLLISTDPTQAIKLRSNNNSKTRSNPLYSHPQPPSKRPRRQNKTNYQNAASPPSSEPELVKTNKTSQLRPALPTLPPTPLTPSEIINSSTLSRLFKKSNLVFSQIATSATDLIESDSGTSNELNQLVELLRGDLSSREWLQVVRTLIQPPPEQDDHYQILTQTLEAVQGLFVSAEPVTVPVIATRLAEEGPLQQRRSSAITSRPPAPGASVQQQQPCQETLSHAEQLESLEHCSIQLSRFLGDLQDYRARLAEIRDGCLAIEKRRRALWFLAKILNAAFLRSCPNAGGRPFPPPSSPSSSSSSSSCSEVVPDGPAEGRRKGKKMLGRPQGSGKWEKTQPTVSTDTPKGMQKKKKSKKKKKDQSSGCSSSEISDKDVIMRPSSSSSSPGYLDDPDRSKPPKQFPPPGPSILSAPLPLISSSATNTLDSSFKRKRKNL
ncbi:hypothetical protein VP01_361g2 [Puccinia sorghi]|uniref:Uncharacterized protein n=1 Tax=Puccinia sorghi TaxID=27349 RepID=A0A0L6UUY3_9BASI|nr:hypothetical protein VP01_361g2 [Puccinia sorghi]